MLCSTEVVLVWSRDLFFGERKDEKDFCGGKLLFWWHFDLGKDDAKNKALDILKGTLPDRYG